MRFAKMIDGTEKPKIFRKIKLILGHWAFAFLQFELFKISLLLALIPAKPDVVKTIFSLILYTNFMIPYSYPLENWFAMYLNWLWV